MATAPAEIQVSTLLKSVDKQIKSGNLEEAAETINKALALEPRNIYARAYSERISLLLEEKKNKLQQIQAEEVKQLTFKDIPKLSEAIVQAYKTLLAEIWQDGVLAQEEEERLRVMRESLGISEDIHEYLSTNARITAFLRTLQTELKSGSSNIERHKRKFGITENEDFIIGPKIQQLEQALKAKAILLLLDDEENFLLITKKLLELQRYYCFTATSGDEAFAILESVIPDLVICDLSFGEHTTGGFDIYEQFRQVSRHAAIPFVFMTGIDKDEAMRRGKMLGADDYLTKPINKELLLATIEGKLARAKQLRTK